MEIMWQVSRSVMLYLQMNTRLELAIHIFMVLTAVAFIVLIGLFGNSSATLVSKLCALALVLVFAGGTLGAMYWQYNNTENIKSTIESIVPVNDTVKVITTSSGTWVFDDGTVKSGKAANYAPLNQSSLNGGPFRANNGSVKVYVTSKQIESANIENARQFWMNIIK